jgi:hypothetical protein
MAAVTVPQTSVCTPWATSADVCSPCDDYNFDSTLLDEALDIASDLLFQFSGRQFPGNCQDTVCPVHPCICIGSRASRRYGNACCCTPRGVELGNYPITGIDEVKVDGAVLDDSLYRVDDWRWLIRLPDADGVNPGWPCCQRFDLPTTEVRTFEVTFTYGMAPPPGGVRAAAALACELALLCQPETIGACRLNPRVTNLDRQGISMVLSDPAQFFPEGRTGLAEVDLWITSVNPAGIRRRATILSPDIGPAVRHAGT